MQTLHQTAGQLNRTPVIFGAARSDDEKWKAVVARDARYDGFFVFAVHSTGVYCRPSCPSRRTGRDNVEFFQGPDEAEKAGFRACQRCRPQDPVSPRSALLARICEDIEKNLGEKITLAKLSAHTGISPFHLQRVFKQGLGVSPRQYAERLRLEKVKDSLRNGKTVNDALYKAGFSSRSRLYEKASGQLGVSPGTLRRGGQGLRISFTTMGSPLGRLLLAATELGICAVCMGSSDSEVEARLAADYPEAFLLRDDNGMKEWVEAFENYFRGQTFPPGLPIDAQATAFQWRVWKQIQSIPFGSTTTYTRIAEALGKPRSVRAVANACGSNPVALVIPCHRVVGKDGRLHGYGWGLERKKMLLSLEERVKPGTGGRD